MRKFDLQSVNETAYGFRSKLLFFVENIEKLRTALGKERDEMRILDVACGNGTQVTIPLGSEGYDVLGVDFHEPSIEYARGENPFKNVNFILKDVEKLETELHGQRFDAIIFSDMLEHVEGPQALLKAVRPLLAPNGILLISIPNGYGPFEVENFILRKLGIIRLGRYVRNIIKNKPQTPYNVENGHVQFFTRKSFDELLKGAGFEAVDFKNGCFFGGSISNAIISKISFLTRVNIKIAKYLPSQLCSAWYFVCRLKNYEH